MMAPASLTRRLIITLTLAAAVLWLLAAFLAGDTMRSRLDAAFDGGLRETAERLLALAVENLHDDGDEHGPGHEMHEVPQSGDAGVGEYIVYQVRFANGSIALRSHDAPIEPFALPLQEGFADSGPWRVFTIGTPDHALFIQVAEAIQHRADTLWSSILSLIVPIGVLVPLSALGIFVAIRSGLRPVRKFSAEIGALHASNLAPIGEAGLPRELLPIAEAVDGLIARVSATIEAERAFAANSAHELRTPLAGSLAQTQRLIEELDGQPAAGRARQIEASLIRLRAMADKLLQLSRADAGIAAAAKPVDLLPALRLLIEDARRTGAGRQIELSVEPGRQLVGSIDVDAFGIAVRNLLENAILHGEPPITVALDAQMIEIANGGPVVGPEGLARLKTRFVRGQTPSSGSGLGLAIADTIIRQAGGTLELVSPAPGRSDGFCARLRLPKAA